MSDTISKDTLRKILTIILTLFTLLFGWAALTVPMMASGGPAVLTLGFAAAAYLSWPKHPRETL